MASKWTGRPGEGTWTWDLSHQLITLSEYHLMTKDASVLPTMKIIVGLLEKAEYNGDVLARKEDPSNSKLIACVKLYDGGFGHEPFIDSFHGYGPMQYTTLLAVTAWQLASRCGVEPAPNCIKRALEFNHHGTNAAGYVAYGGEFTANGGIVDPVAWKKSKDGDNYVGRAGCSIIAHKLSPEFPESIDYADLNQRYMERAYKSMPDGHADANLGILWGIMGAAASGDDKVLRTVLDYHKAYFNMMRCFDGSFVLQPGRDYADDGYYMASRYHPTATIALAYGLSNPKLMIQGIQVSLPGINPKALKGKMDTAYKALVKKSYGEAVAALQNPGPDDATVAATMRAYLEAQAQQSVALLDAVEKTGDIALLRTELTKAQAQFGLLPAFKEKVARLEEGFKQDAWKLELKLAASYRKLVDILKRNKTAAYAGDLERFGERNPDSLYGKWALEVAKEYRSSGAIREPSTNVSLASTSNGTAAPVTSALPSGTPAAGGTTAATEAPAKPQAAVPKAAVSPEALTQWQERFIKKLDALGKAGRKLKIDLGDGQEYFVHGANEQALIVSTQGNDLPMPWRMISLAYRAALAKDASTDDDAESLLIAAVFQLAVARGEQSETLFAKAALKDAEATKRARASLGKP